MILALGLATLLIGVEITLLIDWQIFPFFIGSTLFASLIHLAWLQRLHNRVDMPT